MSQSYRIRVKESLSETIKVDQEWRQRVELLKLLGHDEMSSILEDLMLQEGWEKKEDVLVKSDDNFDLEFDPVSRQVSIRYSEEEEIIEVVDKDYDIYDHGDNQQRAARGAQNQARNELQGKVDVQVKSRSQEIRDRMNREKDSLLESLNEELEQLVEKTHVQALKDKAAQLGEVQSIHEDESSGDVTIRIKV